MSESVGIVIVGLGPGDPDLLTRQAWRLLSEATEVTLRTKRHPIVTALEKLPLSIHSYDAWYDEAESFEALYQRIGEDVVARGARERVIYGTPGHPFVGESTVGVILAMAKDAGIPCQIVAGLSFVEPVLTTINIDGLDGLQLFDAIDLAGYEYPPVNPDVPALIGQVYSRQIASDLKLSLMALYPDAHQVALSVGAGSGREETVWLPLYQIDRIERIDHVTTLYLPATPGSHSLAALADTVAILRSPNGCPWDKEQTSMSLRSDLIEEMAEVLEAIDGEDEAGLCEELGDLLFHIVFQAQIAAEGEAFTLGEVIAGINAKLIRRHPHIWGEAQVSDSEQVILQWEEIKAREKKEKGESLLDNLPAALPALYQSQKIQKRARNVGFDWATIDGVYDKLAEETMELKAAKSSESRQTELGDMLFSVVNLASWLNIDAESALRDANHRFGQRFRQVEKLAMENGVAVDKSNAEQLLAYWDEAKRLLLAKRAT